MNTRTIPLRRITRLVLLLTLSACLVGCGRGIRPISGRVTLNGEPAKDVLVFFLLDTTEIIVPENGIGKTNDKGEFRIRGVDTNRAGVVPGKYKIRLTWQDPDPVQPKYEGEEVKPKPSPYVFPAEVVEGHCRFTVPEKGKVVANFDF